MGYNLTIVRPNDGLISFKELVDAASSIGECSVDTANKRISVKIESEVVLIHLMNQVAFTSNVTSDQVIKKLALLASALGGRLRGDEMETYREDGSSYTHPDDLDELTEHKEQIARLVERRKLITIAKAIILIVVLVCLVINFLKDFK